MVTVGENDRQHPQVIRLGKLTIEEEEPNHNVSFGPPLKEEKLDLWDGWNGTVKTHKE